MVDFALIQEKVYFGYGKAAEKIGELANIYRAPNGIEPIKASNLIGQTYLSQNVNWAYNKANKHGNSVWQLVVDGRVIQQFDYLVTPKFTFFVNAMQPILPVNGVDCNRRVKITRPTKTRTPGANSYGGYEISDVLQMALDMPISIIQGGRMETNQFKLPLDTRSPSFSLLIPKLSGVDPRIGDFVDDDRGVRLALTSVELTDLGYRCMGASEQV